MNSHPPSLYSGFNLETGDRVLFFIKVAVISLIFLPFGVGATAILTAAACTAMAYEWFSMTTQGRVFDEPILPIALCAAAFPPFIAFAVGPIGGTMVASLAAGFLLFMGPKDETGLPRTAAGVFLIAFAGICFVWLRSDPLHGLALTAWLVFVVAATELGSQLVSRILADRDDSGSADPLKELALSLACGAVAGIIVGAFYREGSLFWVIIASILTAAVVLLAGMLTDYVKRSVDGELSGSLFLGRGTVIENFDGLVCASIFAALMMLAGGALFSW